MAGHLKSKSKLRRRGRHIAANPSKITKHGGRVLKSKRKRFISSPRISPHIRNPLTKNVSEGFNDNFIKSLQNITEKYDKTFISDNDDNQESFIKSPTASVEIYNPLKNGTSEDFDEDFNNGMENLIDNYDDTLRNLVKR